MSWFNPVPCALIDGLGCGEVPTPRRAALTWPRCVDEADNPVPEDSREGRTTGLEVCRGNKGGALGSLGEGASASGATSSGAKSRSSAMARWRWAIGEVEPTPMAGVIAVIMPFWTWLHWVAALWWKKKSKAKSKTTSESEKGWSSGGRKEGQRNRWNRNVKSLRAAIERGENRFQYVVLYISGIFWYFLIYSVFFFFLSLYMYICTYVSWYL